MSFLLSFLKFALAAVAALLSVLLVCIALDSLKRYLPRTLLRHGGIPFALCLVSVTAWVVYLLTLG
jgi:hypothetical protein